MAQLFHSSSTFGARPDSVVQRGELRSGGVELVGQDANNNVTEYGYDPHDRRRYTCFPRPNDGTRCTPGDTSMSDPSCNTSTPAQTYERVEYDPNGNVISLKKRDLQVINYTYDALNRLTVKDIPGGTAEDVYSEYDAAGRPLWAKFVSDNGSGLSTATTRRSG